MLVQKVGTTGLEEKDGIRAVDLASKHLKKNGQKPPLETPVQHVLGLRPLLG